MTADSTSSESLLVKFGHKNENDVIRIHFEVEEREGSLQLQFVLQWPLISIYAKKQQHVTVPHPDQSLEHSSDPKNIPTTHRTLSQRLWETKRQENAKKVYEMQNTVSSAWKIEAKLFSLL